MAPCPRPYWLHGQDGVSKKHDDEVAKTLGVSSGPERTTPLPRCVEVGSLTAAGGAAEHELALRRLPGPSGRQAHGGGGAGAP